MPNGHVQDVIFYPKHVFSVFPMTRIDTAPTSRRYRPTPDLDSLEEPTIHLYASQQLSEAMMVFLGVEVISSSFLVADSSERPFVSSTC
jgi:hypothetical protein